MVTSWTNKSKSDGNVYSLIDSYSEKNVVTSGSMYNGLFINRGNYFTNTISAKLYSAIFYLESYGSPTGNATASVYASTLSGGYYIPTGSALATSDAFDVSKLTNSNQLITFNFTGTNQIALNPTTVYCIEINYSGGNSANYIKLGLGGATTTGGNYSLDGTNWYGATRNCAFYVYSYIIDTWSNKTKNINTGYTSYPDSGN